MLQVFSGEKVSYEGFVTFVVVPFMAYPFIGVCFVVLYGKFCSPFPLQITCVAHTPAFLFFPSYLTIFLFNFYTNKGSIIDVKSNPIV